MSPITTALALVVSVGMFCLFGFGFIVLIAKLAKKR